MANAAEDGKTPGLMSTYPGDEARIIDIRVTMR